MLSTDTNMLILLLLRGVNQEETSFAAHASFIYLFCDNKKSFTEVVEKCSKALSFRMGTEQQYKEDVN